MNLEALPDLREFRARARSWLADNTPKSPRPSAGEQAAAFDKAWQRKLFDGGWAGLNWPAEFGGAGLSGVQCLIWFEECERAEAPGYGLMTISQTHAGPTLIARGNEDQKSYHLPRILQGDSLWCQGFSEPGAGSDLAALQTRGEIDGDHVVVHGQKTWTSGARHADFQELLIRTTPGSKRHAGLTWIICDMRSDGLEVRPIKTMMGESEICEVFYDGVRIPRANIVGELNEGWSVAMSTLAFERGTTFLRDQIAIGAKVERAIDLAKRVRLADGRLAIDDAGIASRLAQHKIEALSHRSMALANVSRVDKTGAPGPEGSMVKLLVTTTNKHLNETVAEILGLNFLDYAQTRNSNPWTYDFMWGWVLTIAGGASEIQREIIADRVMSLPRAR
ncbi:MAG: acyl-CoA dehydrogenase family protein [Hyphomonadaceae bacterium]|nr:acyl-CoA dehydrogenase family protein [Hyphomonadaceae bacterium]